MSLSSVFYAESRLLCGSSGGRNMTASGSCRSQHKPASAEVAVQFSLAGQPQMAMSRSQPVLAQHSAAYLWQSARSLSAAAANCAESLAWEQAGRTRQLWHLEQIRPARAAAASQHPFAAKALPPSAARAQHPFAATAPSPSGVRGPLPSGAHRGHTLMLHRQQLLHSLTADPAGSPGRSEYRYLARSCRVSC